MSRVINPESAGKERNRLSKAIVIAIREFMKQPEPNETSKDIAAFIILSLEQIDKTIDLTVAPLGKKRLLGQSRPLSHGLGVGQTRRTQHAQIFPSTRLDSNCDAIHSNCAKIQQYQSL